MITAELFGNELIIGPRIEPSSLLVYLVKYEGGDHILKVSRKNDLFDLDQMKTEQRILEACEDLKGITHLVKKYDLSKSEDYETALLKEYVAGSDLARKQRPLLPHLKEELKRTILRLHQRRVAGLELTPENVVVSSDEREVKIVDFGSGSIFSQEQENELKYWVERDYFNLQCLVKRMQRTF